MPSLHAAEPQFPDDDGAADPAVLATLAAYAAGRGSEHAALTALAASRLLVPMVALLTEEAAEDGGSDNSADVPRPGGGLRREKTTEMAMPTLIGRDGRAAILAFTSLDALARWRPDARPVAVPAARAWQAGSEEASAVVIDVAGPVPITVEGARLAALAAGRPAPLPHQDPDVLAALHAALGDEPLIVQAALSTPDQRAGWEYGPRPEDLPDLAARNGPELAALGLDLPSADPDGASPDGAGRDGVGSPNGDGTSAGATSASRGGAGGGDPGADGAASDGAGAPAAGPDAAGQVAPGQGAPGQGAAGQDLADLALQVTLAAGCDPAAATAAVRRVAEALLTSTGGRLRRGMEISVAQPRAR